MIQRHRRHLVNNAWNSFSGSPGKMTEFSRMIFEYGESSTARGALRRIPLAFQRRLAFISSTFLSLSPMFVRPCLLELDALVRRSRFAGIALVNLWCQTGRRYQTSHFTDLVVNVYISLAVNQERHRHCQRELNWWARVSLIIVLHNATLR